MARITQTEKKQWKSVLSDLINKKIDELEHFYDNPTDRCVERIIERFAYDNEIQDLVSEDQALTQAIEGLQYQLSATERQRKNVRNQIIDELNVRGANINYYSIDRFNWRNEATDKVHDELRRELLKESGGDEIVALQDALVELDIAILRATTPTELLNFVDQFKVNHGL